MSDDKNQVETTGHQWDDDEGYPLTEYNNPLPRWWLYTFYATIAWAVVYWFLYPAWPGIGADGFTKGSLGWSQYQQLEEEMAEGRAIRAPFDRQLAAAKLSEVAQNPGLLAYATSGGKAIFGDNCAPCHGSGGVGSKAAGFPALVDDDWIFGGSLEAIDATINHGRTGLMPAHLEAAGGAFSAAQVTDLAQYVMQISHQDHDAAAASRGDALFHGDAACNSCHGDQGMGSLNDTVAGEAIDDATGAPNLTDAVWLYQGDLQTVTTTISRGRTGKMPAWGEGFDGFGRKLDPLDIKKVVLYVHNLGGGQ